MIRKVTLFGEAVMKAFMREPLDEELHLKHALDQLDKQQEGIKKIAVPHYAPIQETVVGGPEQTFPFHGSSRLAEPLIRKSVSAVFHGHAPIVNPGGIVK